MAESSRGDRFSGGVAVLFSARVFGAVVGIVNGILLARLLGPAGKGEYYILVLVPATAMVLLQLGLPHAFNYYSARGQTRGITWRAVAATVLLSAVAAAIVAAIVPVVHDTVLEGAEPSLIALAFLSLPLALFATFATGIVMGRKAVRWYVGVNIAYPLVSTILLVVLVGGFGLSVTGAIFVYLVANLIQAVGFAVATARVMRAVENPAPVGTRELSGYGLRFYPSSLAEFFSYRVDAYLLAFLIANSSEALGYYSMAVGLAEMVFFFPTAVSTLFFPHVAGAARGDADRQVPLVSRVTTLVTAVVAVLLIPAAAVMIALILPAFRASMAPLIVLLPGVVALSTANVVVGYLTGIGRPGVASTINLVALAVNIGVNLVMIPILGIVGAAAASLLSYSLTAILVTAAAARASGSPLHQFWIPRGDDARFVLATILGLLQRLRTTARGVA
jgi:O-antigen/teichoic acid export membrane protein